MRWSYRVFRVRGISVELHLTFILLFLLLAFGGLEGIALITILFTIVLAHELVHSLTATFYGIRVPRIILTPIGGLASIELPDDPMTELTVSIVGPLFNFMLAAIGILMLMAIDSTYNPASVLTDISTYWGGDFQLTSVIGLLRMFVSMNLILGGFNILPAFPMDGGRVFRSVLALWMDSLSATKIANAVAQLIFLILIMYGVWETNLWYVLMGVFLSYAGSSEISMVSLKKLVSGYRLIDIAKPSVNYADHTLSWRDFLSTVYRKGENIYLIVDPSGVMRGVIDMRDLRGADLGRPIGEYPGAEYTVLDGGVPVSDALKYILTRRLVLVVSSGKFVGYVTSDTLAESATYLSLVKRFH